MLKIYHGKGTRSVRTVWLALELGLDYALVDVGFAPPTKPFSQKSPYGKVPMIEDGDVTIMESGAINEYLVDRYGGGWLAPDRSSPAWAEYLQWTHFAEATLMVPLSELIRETLFKAPADRIASVAEAATLRTKTILEFVDRSLAGKNFLLGPEFSAADIPIGYSLFWTNRLGILGDDVGRVKAYWERLEARPAWKKAIAS